MFVHDKFCLQKYAELSWTLVRQTTALNCHIYRRCGTERLDETYVLRVDCREIRLRPSRKHHRGRLALWLAWTAVKGRFTPNYALRAHLTVR